MTLQAHTGRRLLAALALIVISAIAPVPALAADKGIETDLTWSVSNRERDRTIAGVRDLGAKWMRITISWSDIETAQGVYTTSHYDSAINRAVDSGAQILATVHTAPAWASGESDRDAPPRDPAHFADFLRWAATRWGDKIHAWEVWNEPNVSGNPAEYAELLKAAYPAIKLADPTAQVVYGGLWGNDYRFVEGSYAAAPDLGAYFDVMATHPYTQGTPPEEVADHDLAFPSYREVRDVMLANGDDKPLWFTEFGWSTNTAKWGVSADQQAEYLTRAFRCVEQDPYVELAIWHIYRNYDWAKNANTWDDQLGLVYTNFSRKPAYAAFKNYAESSEGCAYTRRPDPEPVADPAPEPVLSPEPVPTPPPEPAPADPAPEPQAEVESVSVTRAIELELVRAARNARTTSGKRRAPFDVRGQVAGRRGRVDFRLKCEGRRRAHWRSDVEWHVEVNRDKTFTGRFRARRNGSCRLRAAWRAFGVILERSPVVRFRT